MFPKIQRMALGQSMVNYKNRKKIDTQKVEGRVLFIATLEAK